MVIMVQNKHLAVIIILAVIFSLIGNFVSIERLAKIRPAPLQQPTGFATTGVGNVSVNIITSTDITILNSTIDFGSGIVNNTNSYCENATLHTNGTGLNNDNCWINASDDMLGTGYAAPVRLNATGIVIRNDGNKNLSITMDSDDNDAATFIGITVAPASEYNYTVQSEEANSCPADYLHTNTWYGVSNNASMQICSDMNWQDTSDTVNITFRIVFSANATGFKNDTLTFTGAMSSAT